MSHIGSARGTSFILQRIQSRMDQFIPGEWRHADGQVKIKKNGELSYVVKDGGQCFSAIVNQQGKFEILFPGGSILAKIKNENTMIWEDGAEWSRVCKPRRTNSPSENGRTPKRKRKENNVAEDRYTAVKKHPAEAGTPKREHASKRQEQDDDIILIGDDDESSSTAIVLKDTISAEGKDSSSLIVIPKKTNETGEIFTSNYNKEKRKRGDPGPVKRRKHEMQDNNQPQGSRLSYAEEGFMLTEAQEAIDNPSEVNQAANPEIKTREVLNELWGDSS